MTPLRCTLLLCAVLLSAGCGDAPDKTGRLVCADCEAVGQPAYVWMNPEASALACTVPWRTTVTLHQNKRDKWLITAGDCSGFVAESLVRVNPTPTATP